MIMAPRLALIVILMFSLMGCTASGYQVGQAIPRVLAGESKDIPPPRGTPEYEEWLKKPGPVPKSEHRQP